MWTRSTKDVSTSSSGPHQTESVVQPCDGENKRNELVGKSDLKQFLSPYIGQVKLKF